VKNIQVKSACCLLFMLLIVWSLPVGAAEDSQPKEAKVAATVNGSPIYAGELEWQWRRYLRKAGQRGLVEGPAKRTRQDFLEGLIRQEIAFQKAGEAGFKPDAKAVEAEVKSLRVLFVDEAAFALELSRLGLREESLRRMVEKSLVIRRWVEETFVHQQTVTEQEAQDWYQQNRSRLQKPEQVCARHLLVKIDPTGGDTAKEQARHRAEAMRQRWLAGESFADLCRQFSDCPSAEHNGDLGCFSRDEMVASFSDVAFSLQPGAVSKVVETQDGFHLIQVYERIKPAVSPFTEVKEKIIEKLRAAKARPQIDAYLDAKRRAATVVFTPSP